MVGEEPSLFDRVLVVTFSPQSNSSPSQTGPPKPCITYRFPPSSDGKDALAESVCGFCYPESTEEITAKLKSSFPSDTFSFMLTDSSGGKTYGYCRRFKTGSDAECFCILSHHTSFSLFSHVLDIVEKRRKQSSSAVFAFLKAVLAHPFPAPGESFTVKTFSQSETPDLYTLARPNDEYLLDHISYFKLFSAVKQNDVLKLWECLLCERRMVFCSKSLGLLSACLYALTALLYPFSWQHIFIPILPPSLIHYVTAPMPFFVGILSSSKAHLNGLPLEEVVIWDLDTQQFVQDPGFDHVVPGPIFCTLKNSLCSLTTAGKRDREYDQEVGKAFLRFFYRIFATYPKFIDPPKPAQKNSSALSAVSKKKNASKPRAPHGDFNREAFAKSQPEEVQHFLNVFGETQIYETFIVEKEEMMAQGKLQQCRFIRMGYEFFGNSAKESAESFTCSHCHRGVNGGESFSFGDMHFHENCFSCVRCKTPLLHLDFSTNSYKMKSTSDGTRAKLYCGTCRPAAGAGSGQSFLSRVKHAVERKIDKSDELMKSRFNIFAALKKDEKEAATDNEEGLKESKMGKKEQPEPVKLKSTQPLSLSNNNSNNNHLQPHNHSRSASSHALPPNPKDSNNLPNSSSSSSSTTRPQPHSHQQPQPPFVHLKKSVSNPAMLSPPPPDPAPLPPSSYKPPAHGSKMAAKLPAVQIQQIPGNYPPPSSAHTKKPPVAPPVTIPAAKLKTSGNNIPPPLPKYSMAADNSIVSNNTNNLLTKKNKFQDSNNSNSGSKSATNTSPNFTAITTTNTSIKAAIAFKNANLLLEANDSRETVSADYPPEVCSGCRKPLFIAGSTDPYPVVCNLSGYFHPDCFVCTKCKKPINDNYIPKDGLPYHSECAHKYICSVCNLPVKSKYLEISKKIIHIDCFVCTQCNKLLVSHTGSSHKYIESDNMPYCMDCMRV